MDTQASEEALADAAAQAEALATLLQSQPRGRTVEGWAEVANAGDTFGFFDFSPVFGRANPLAPPVRMGVAEDEVRGTVRWGAAYEGPPGCVHGGHIAAAFDEVLGMTQSLSGAPGMTGILTIKYRSPTPLHTDLDFVGARQPGRRAQDLHRGHVEERRRRVRGGRGAVHLGRLREVRGDARAGEPRRGERRLGERRDEVEHLVSVAFELHRPDARNRAECGLRARAVLDDRGERLVVEDRVRGRVGGASACAGATP